MELTVIKKDVPFKLSAISKQVADAQTFYFGAGWDNPNGPVDLDIVAVALENGKITKQSDLVYFSNKTGSTGIVLSEDNTTGEGDGDDEDIVINTSLIPANIDQIAVGLACYSRTNFAEAPNVHFRVCDGDNEESEQIGDVAFDGSATSSDTVLVAFVLSRTADGWVLENKSELHALGNGTDAILGFGGLYS